MIIQFEISEHLYKYLKKRIELNVASELDMLVDKGTVIEQEPKTEWIPVSERLPEKGASYLVTEQAFGGHTFMDVIGFARDLSLVSDYEFKDKKRPGWFDYDSEYGYYERTDVIAWQPLPERYSEV